MNYNVRYIRGTELIALESFDEYPPQDHLDEMLKITGADYYDICRKEDNE